MRILDIDDKEITSPDLDKGHLEPDKLFIQHHDATEAKEAVTHLELLRIYENGGKEFETIIDFPAVEAHEAWDEYEDVLRYILYTPEELAKIEEERARAEAEKQRVPNLEKENKLLHNQVQALSDQNDFQEELIVELANIVYA